MACVGQTSMQALQLPQCASTGGVGGSAQVDEDLAQEEHRAAVALQRQRVLAAPAHAAARGQLHLQHRRRIGEHAVAQRADLLRQPVGQRLQPRAQHLVVVAAARIERHRRLLRARAGAATPPPASPARCRAAGSPCAR